MISDKRRPGRRRRLGTIAATVAITGAVSLTAAACAGNGGTGASGGGNTLKLTTWVNPPAVAVLKQINAEFEKANPGTSVTLNTAANVNGPYQTLLQQSVNSGSADIVTANTPLLPLPKKLNNTNATPIQLWETNGQFADLSGQSFTKDYTSSALSAQTYQGKVYGLTSGEYQEGVFYNKAIFSKYHLSVPTTYSQFLSVCKTLKSHGVQPLYTALGQVGSPYTQFLYYEAMTDLWYPKAPGGNLANAIMNDQVKWTDPAFVKGMSEEKQIAQYLEPNYTGINWQTMAGGPFAAGKAAMELDGSWDLPSIQKANPKLQAGYFPVPFSSSASANQAYAQNDLTFYVLKNAKNKSLAMKWLQFFSTPKIYAQYVNATGISSAQKSGTFTGYASQVMGKWFGKGVNQTTLYPALSPSNGYYDQQANWADLQLEVMQGKMSPQQAAATYQKDWKG
ncbi:MAG: extracellular solute-binding protein [Streptosporangiales bacterium]|nr:extracellular solute-binding protein [Streptosporangiales bacterium]